MDEKNKINKSSSFTVQNQLEEKSCADIISLVCGIMSIFICWISLYPLVLGLIGIILGIIGLIKNRNEIKTSIIGILLSSIGFFIGIIKLIVVIILVKSKM